MILLKKIARVLKIFVGFSFLLMILLNLSVFVFLSFPFVQKQIVNSINRNYMNTYGISIGLSSLEVVFWPSSLVLNDASLSTIDPLNKNDKILITSRRILISLDVTKSYIHRQFMFKSLSVSGLDINLPLTDDGQNIDLFLFNSKKSKKPFETVKMISQLNKQLPPLIEITNLYLNLENKTKTISYQSLFKSIVLNNYEKNLDMDLSILLQEIKIKNLILKNDFLITSLNSKINVSKKGLVKVKQLSFLSNLINSSIHGSLQLNDILEKSHYSFDIKTEINNKNVLEIFNLKSRGTSISHFSVLGKNLTSFPILNGFINWENAILNQYDLFNGKSHFSLKEKKLNLSSLQINFPNKASIFGSGYFNFYDEFPFAFNVQAKSLSFIELMKALGVPTQAFEFKFNSSQPLVVSGLISPKKTKSFHEIFLMEITTVLEATQLHVPSIGYSKKSGSLPDSSIRIKLLSTNNMLTLSGTELTFEDSHGYVSKITATQGTINYSSGHTHFILSAPKIKLDSFGYFLGSQTEGVGTLNGELVSNKNSPLSFTSHIDFSNFLIYSVRFSKLSGKWGINGKETFGNHLSAEIKKDSTSQPLYLNLEEFKLRLNDLFIHTVGSVEGSLGSFFENSYFPMNNYIKKIKGNIKVQKFLFNGPIFNSKQLTLRTDVKINNGSINNLNNFDADIFIDCFQGRCVKSSLHLVSTNNSYSFQILVDELSKNAFITEANVNSLPLDKILNTGGLESEINGNIKINSNWKLWQNSGHLQIKNISYLKNKFEPISIEMNTLHKYNELSIKAQNGQINGYINVPKNLLDSIDSKMVLNNFDLVNFIPESILKKNGYASISATLESNLSLEKFKQNYHFLSHFKSSMTINKLHLKLSDQNISLKSPTKINLSNGKLFLNHFELISNYFKFYAAGFSDIHNDNNDFAIELETDLNILKEFLPFIASAKGDANLGLRITGPMSHPKFHGNAKIQKSSIYLNDYGPNIENLEGQFTIAGNKVEINYLRANKGVGKIDVIGSLSLSNKNHDIALKMTLDKTDIRFQLPVLQTLDSNLSGEVTLTGSQKPYTLGGQIKILKARAFRDITCPDITSELSSKMGTVAGLTDTPTFDFSLKISAENNINIQTQCFRGRLGLNAHLTGHSLAPMVTGNSEIPIGQVNLLKGRFTIRQATLLFDNPVRIDPRADIQMDARIGVYNIFLTLEGPMSRLKVNLWTDPATLPKSDNLITQQDIIDMLMSGSPPTEFAQRSGGRTFVNVFSTLFGTGIGISNALNQAISRATLGLVETMQVEPLIENGEAKARVRLNHNIVDKFNLGMEFLSAGSSAPSASFSGTLLLTENVNLLGGFNYKPTLDREQQTEFTGGMRFQFGSR